jgi:hypothetical protein
MAHAANQGAYAGLGLGVDKVHVGDVSPAFYNKHDTQLAGRVFGGYNFNEYVGVEAGYNAFGTTKQTVNTFYGPVEFKSRFDSFDVRGKAYLPVMNNTANLYALGGVAYARNEDVHAYRPVYGVGANYDVTKQVTAAVEVTRQQKNSSTMPNIDTLMFTAAYNFA